MAANEQSPNYEQWFRNILASAAREATAPIFTKKEWDEAGDPECDEEDCEQGDDLEEFDNNVELKTIRNIAESILAKVSSSIGNSDPRAAESYVDVLLKLQQYRQNKLEGY